VFLSMTAYFMQELILEPYAGLVFGFTPGQSTSLSGAQNGGVFLGMLTVGIAATGLRIGTLRTWVVAGLPRVGRDAGIASLGRRAKPPLVPAVVGLGIFNGMFAVAAIGSMMALAGEGRGAAKARAWASGARRRPSPPGSAGLGAAAVDVMRGPPRRAGLRRGLSGEALLFVIAPP
jgi:BCD family chlorophyll transporter-like MFS transporter